MVAVNWFGRQYSAEYPGLVKDCPARSCCGSAGLCQDGKLVPMTETTLLAYLDSLVGQLEGQAC